MEPDLDVIRLQVPVANLRLVDGDDTLEQLVSKAFDLFVRQPFWLFFEKIFEVLRTSIFENHVNFGRQGIFNIVHNLDNIWLVQQLV